METRIAELLMWVCLQVGCEPPPPPEVQYVPRVELAQMVYGDRSDGGPDICGLYLADRHTIFLPDDHCPEDLLDESALVHELVHHVQVATGMDYPCPAAREPLAYRLQAQWLGENGVEDPYALMQVDDFTIFIRSICGPE